MTMVSDVSMVQKITVEDLDIIKKFFGNLKSNTSHLFITILHEEHGI